MAIDISTLEIDEEVKEQIINAAVKYAKISDTVKELNKERKELKHYLIELLEVAGIRDEIIAITEHGTITIKPNTNIKVL